MGWGSKIRGVQMCIALKMGRPPPAKGIESGFFGRLMLIPLQKSANVEVFVAMSLYMVVLL